MKAKTMTQTVDLDAARKAAGLLPDEHPLILRNPKDPSTPLQLQKHQWDFAVSPAYATFLAGGWFSGKSYALLQWLAMRAFMNPTGTSGMVALPTHKLLTEFLRQYLIPAFGWDEGGMIVGGSSDEGALYLRGNRRLLYRSAHEPKRIEASDLSYVGADEIGLMKSEVFVRMVARTRDARATMPFLGFTGVPVFGWLQEEFENRWDMQRRIIHITSADNKLAGKEALGNLLDACPARLRPCYIDGRFVPPGNVVYHQITDDHLLDWRVEDYVQPERAARRRSELCVSVDPGGHTPHVTFFQIVPPGVRLPNGILTTKPVAIAVDEVIESGRDEHMITTEQLATVAKAKGYHLQIGYMDVAGDTEDQTSGLTPLRIFADKMGIEFERETDPALRSIVNSIELVWRMLAPETGHPTLYFAKHLADSRNPRALWNAMRRQHYPVAKDGRPLSDKPEKDGVTDHACDTVRYLAVNDRRFVPDAWLRRITQYRAG
jgi:hypothetical protein